MLSERQMLMLHKVLSCQSILSLGFCFFLQAAANPVATSATNPVDPKTNSTSKWSKIKIVTKQTGDECITAIEIVPPVEGSERHSIPINRPRTVARKFASIARSQVKRKRQMAAREKKVCKFNIAKTLSIHGMTLTCHTYYNWEIIAFNLHYVFMVPLIHSTGTIGYYENKSPRLF